MNGWGSLRGVWDGKMKHGTNRERGGFGRGSGGGGGGSHSRYTYMAIITLGGRCPAESQRASPRVRSLRDTTAVG